MRLNSPFRQDRRLIIATLVTDAVNIAARGGPYFVLAMKGGYGADSGLSRDGPGRDAIRPFETIKICLA